MRSVPEDRRKQAQQVWRHWRRLVSEWPLSDWTQAEFEQRERDTLKRLAELCLPEISEAFQEVGLERFSEITTKIASAAIYHAVETVTESKRPIYEYVKVCVKEALEEHVRAFDEWFYQAEAEQLLPLLLGLPRPALAKMAEHLNRKQRSGLRQLLYRELGNKPMLLRLDREPLGQRQWLYWFLWRWEMTQPGARRVLSGVPLYLFAAQSETLPTNKHTGEPLDPLAPIHAKALQHLGPEINKHGAINISHPHNKKRIADSFGVDRSTLERYLKADIGKEPRPDGNGGVTYTFTGEDALRAIEEVMRKPGPRPSDR